MPGVRIGITDERLQRAEDALRHEVARRAFDQRSDIDDRSRVIVRDILPALDFDSPTNNAWVDDNGGTPERRWAQDLAAGGGGAEQYTVAYNIDSTSLADNKVIAFLVARATSTDPTTSQIRFRTGLSGPGSTVDVWQVQGLQVEEDASGVAANAVFSNVDDNMRIEFFQELANDERWVLEGAVGEAAGETVAAPQEAVLAGGGGGGGRRERSGVVSEPQLQADGGWDPDTRRTIPFEELERRGRKLGPANPVRR